MDEIIRKVALVHLRDGRLLTTRSAGRTRFYLPGGKPEAGEDDAAALVREVREELGVRIDPASIQPWGHYSHPADAQRPGTLVETAAFTADFTGEPVASSEVEEVAWLEPTVQGADRSPAHKPDPAVFDAALAQLRCLGVTRVSYVGDAVMDAQAAAGAGLDFVAVTTAMVGADAFPGVPVAADITAVAQHLGL